jgi:hypothetical protein
VHKQVFIHAILKTGKKGNKTELAEGSPRGCERPLWTVVPSKKRRRKRGRRRRGRRRRRRSVLICFQNLFTIKEG